ncbi:winged helix-turn-helix domain-containing protein [Streptomyces sp. x-80]|uniref:winged helix-turn-helix domain-containing protein n=1 Tax=Streptomyces sp. x-80 TaxID=2789282 RepID=UPI00397ECAD7
MALVQRRHGHEVDAVPTGEEGLALLGRPGPRIELVVLDLMLPDMDGFEVCRRIRTMSTTPVIMLTARGDDIDVVSGLAVGADDYVVKLVTAVVLEARIRAAPRRVEPAPRTPLPRGMHGGLTIDRAGLTVCVNGAPVQLPPTELRLLLELSALPDQVFSREQYLQLVWEQGFRGDSRLVDAAVGALRAKIEDQAAKPRCIQTVRGFGYRFGRL